MLNLPVTGGIPSSFVWTAAERAVWKPREDLTVSQWAPRYRFVVKGPAQGLWTNELTPYAIEPMDAWTMPWVRHIILCFPPQSAKTQIALNCLMYSIDQDPGPAMYIMSSENTAKRISRRQIIPTIKASPRTASQLSRRVDDTATTHISFRNGMDLIMAWATSAAEMASESIKYLFRDEPGKYPDFAGKEADPFSLSEARMNAYTHTSKVMDFSTPNLDGDAFDRLCHNDPDEVRVYHARCPFCKTLQIMADERIHANGVRDPRTILRRNLGRYTCANCGMDWDDFRRDQAVRGGCYVAEKPVERPRCIFFKLPGSWYSPFISLSQALAAFFKGREDPKKFMAYVTQHKTEAWKEVIEAKEESNILTHRSEFPPMVVPPDCVALTAGIDVQKLGFWFVVRAWEIDLTSHNIMYGYLSSFADVETLVFETRFKKQGADESLPIWRAAMDTGGGTSSDDEWTRTEEIYQWLRSNGRGVVFGVKGSSRPQLSRIKVSVIDKMKRGNRVIPGGLELRILDVSQLKDLLHWRLTRKAGESQRFYLHSETGMDYARQFLAEEKRRDRRHKIEWVQIRADNHLLDCEVMAAACADSEWMPSLTMIAQRMKKSEGAAPQKRVQPPKNKIDLW